MASSNSLHNITKLAGASNYASWAVDIKYVLMDKEVWKVVDGTSTKPPVLDPDHEPGTLGKPPHPDHLSWSKENSKACATIALTCLEGPKQFIKDLSARQMWLKLKELYEIRGFNARYLAFNTLLSHHYDNSKLIEDYVEQVKKSSLRLKEVDPAFPDWIILTVLLNNLGSSFTAFVTAKRKAIQVTVPTFDALAAELIGGSRTIPLPHLLIVSIACLSTSLNDSSFR